MSEEINTAENPEEAHAENGANPVGGQDPAKEEAIASEEGQPDSDEE